MIKCKEHPKYKGLKPPQTFCVVCGCIYLEKHKQDKKDK